jgi:hypothetical protein
MYESFYRRSRNERLSEEQWLKVRFPVGFLTGSSSELQAVQICCADGAGGKATALIHCGTPLI